MSFTVLISTPSMKSKRFSSGTAWLLLPFLLLITDRVVGVGFAARISPPRFELSANPGDVLREVIEIGNADEETANYVIRTADWDLNESGGVIVHPEALQPGSCRPWTKIERRALSLPPDGQKRFRFEVHVPGDAPTGECRFAILIAPDPDSAYLATMGDVSFPVAGQIAVIVYVAVGDARSELSLEAFQLQEVDGRTVPVARISNSGNAHGRPRGLLEGTHANGGKQWILSFLPPPSCPVKLSTSHFGPRHPSIPTKQCSWSPQSR